MNQSIRDETLVSQAQSGQTEAFGTLYVRHMDAIFRFIYFRLHDRTVAEDLTEQVFLKAWEALPNFKQLKNPFKSWLYRIARNSVIDYQRKQARHPHVPLSNATDIDIHTDSSLELLIQGEERKHLLAAMLKLPDLQQRVLLLRFVEGLSHDEIGKILDKSAGACRTIQYRALTMLNNLLREKEPS